VAHAEASAKSVDAAVTAAAAQLGLRSDQVDVEVLEDPVPSSFGYIGSPARVRVTPRTASQDAGLANGPYDRQPTEEAAEVPPVTAPPSTVGIPDAPVVEAATSNPTEATALRTDAVPGPGDTPQAPDQSLVASEGPKPAVAAPPGPDSNSPTPSELSSATKPSRRTYRDEPIEPAMVEVDTERAGDFLEGLLDALDVDGDITTWIDEVGGHIDLEGSDLNMLVGTNGETLDAMQELTRLAVLRQSKRRVRLLLDINGFRARQRQQLTSIVQSTVEQVLKSREEHEFQPMTPAERKVVHDAVAAIDGVYTESLGEEPNRRVVIRPT
jgi:spoIIIJ-associated protein